MSSIFNVARSPKMCETYTVPNEIETFVYMYINVLFRKILAEFITDENKENIKAKKQKREKSVG